MHAEPFGRLLAQFRTRLGLTQEQLAAPEHKLSTSYVAMLEQARRGTSEKRPALSRHQVWCLAEKLDLLPPDCDAFLEAAGHSRDRTAEEELSIQRRFPTQKHEPLKQMFIFARVLLDVTPEWYATVKDNILRHGVKYHYFTTKDDPTFDELLANLQRDAGKNRTILQDRLECIYLPEELFVSNFALYNPGRPNMYCCGTKPEHGRAAVFYTLHLSQADRLYEMLVKLRKRVLMEQPILLDPAQQVFPNHRTAVFAHERPTERKPLKKHKQLGTL
jgi:transcriptional regulator with XRE-family HTH domain